MLDKRKKEGYNEISKNKEGNCDVKRIFVLLLVLGTIGSTCSVSAVAEEKQILTGMIMPRYEANCGPTYDTLAS